MTLLLALSCSHRAGETREFFRHNQNGRRIPSWYTRVKTRPNKIPTSSKTTKTATFSTAAIPIQDFKKGIGLDTRVLYVID